MWKQMFSNFPFQIICESCPRDHTKWWNSWTLFKSVLKWKIGKHVLSHLKTCDLKTDVVLGVRGGHLHQNSFQRCSEMENWKTCPSTLENMCFENRFCTGSGRRTPTSKFLLNSYGLSPPPVGCDKSGLGLYLFAPNRFLSSSSFIVTLFPPNEIWILSRSRTTVKDGGSLP